MTACWIDSHRHEFARDLVRDFCLCVRELSRQFKRFEDSAEMDFEALRELLGEEMNKGPMWRLKDTAHHLVRGSGKGPAELIDWSIGYIFHETLKLKEDAYQRSNYGARFPKGCFGPNDPEAEVAEHLAEVIGQTLESIRREIARIRFIVQSCLRLFPLYLADQSENHLLARFLFEERELAVDVMAQAYDQVVEALFPGRPAKVFELAAKSLREGGWLPRAEVALVEGLRAYPGDPDLLREKNIVATWRERLAV